MSKLKPISATDIEQSKNDREIVHKTALQIIKDFAEFGFDVQFPENINFAYQQLYNQLEEHIRFLISSNLQKLYALLYRIDISDAQIRKKQDVRFDLHLAEIITDLVLERELKKVLFREYYKRYQ